MVCPAHGFMGGVSHRRQSQIEPFPQLRNPSPVASLSSQHKVIDGRKRRIVARLGTKQLGLDVGIQAQLLDHHSDGHSQDRIHQREHAHQEEVRLAVFDSGADQFAETSPHQRGCPILSRFLRKGGIPDCVALGILT